MLDVQTKMISFRKSECYLNTKSRLSFPSLVKTNINVAGGQFKICKCGNGETTDPDESGFVKQTRDDFALYKIGKAVAHFDDKVLIS